MNWMLMPYARYFDFSGRSRRMEYWMFQLFIVLVYIAWFILLAISAGGGDLESAGSNVLGGILVIALVIFALGTVIPNLAVTVRRLHDTDHSGWWILISFVPIIGALVLLYFTLIEGTRGTNRFGPDPKEGLARGV